MQALWPEIKVGFRCQNGFRHGVEMNWIQLKRVIIIAALPVLSGCIASHDEVLTKYTSDHKLQAKVVEINAGATAPFIYEVYVNDIVVAKLVSSLRNERAYGVNVAWEQLPGEDHLRIIYYRAKSVKQPKSSLQLNGHSVKVELVSNILDEKAPDGGMKYNLQLNSSNTL